MRFKFQRLKSRLSGPRSGAMCIASQQCACKQPTPGQTGLRQDSFSVWPAIMTLKSLHERFIWQSYDAAPALSII